MKRLLLASTSTVYGSNYLEYLFPVLENFFSRINTILFIPYARAGGKTYNEYTDIVRKSFSNINKNIVGIHEFENPKKAIQEAKAIFVGGGNTFELVNQIYIQDIFSDLKEVVENGTPYLGTSAGSNVAGVTMMNTNDMPIVYPPSFKTFEFIPFNINAHYLDPDISSKHMGETRETRIKEFHVFNNTSVLGLREGNWLEVNKNQIILKGPLSARWFKQQRIPVEIDSNEKINKYF